MSEQFFYVHLKFTQEIVVEVPRGSLNQRQSDLVGKGFTEKALALDLARDVALKMASAFPATGERAAGCYDEDPPIWYNANTKTGLMFISVRKSRISSTLKRFESGI